MSVKALAFQIQLSLCADALRSARARHCKQDLDGSGREQCKAELLMKISC